jgi:hypothetical protein
LPASELARHIAWDNGAASVTEALSEILDAPAILCNTSRLVIDCNRHLDASDLIPEVSDGTVIPRKSISPAISTAALPICARCPATGRRSFRPVWVALAIAEHPSSFHRHVCE